MSQDQQERRANNQEMAEIREYMATMTDRINNQEHLINKNTEALIGHDARLAGIIASIQKLDTLPEAINGLADLWNKANGAVSVFKWITTALAKISVIAASLSACWHFLQDGLINMWHGLIK